jgi:hypothetical protein
MIVVEAMGSELRKLAGPALRKLVRYGKGMTAAHVAFATA